MGVLKVLLKIIAAIVILLCLTFVVFIATRPDDIPPFDDSHLRLEIQPIPDTENAYFNYKKAGDIYWEEFKKRPEKYNLDIVLLQGVKENYNPNPKDWIEKNNKTIELVVKGNAMHSYQSPIYPESFGNQIDVKVIEKRYSSPIPLAIRQRGLVKFFGIQSGFYILDGDIEKSYDSIVSNLIFTKNISNNPHTLLDLLLVTGIKAVSFNITERIISGDLFNNNQLLEIQNILKDFPYFISIMSNTFLNEYTFISYLSGDRTNAHSKVQFITGIDEYLYKDDNSNNMFSKLLEIPEIWESVYSPNKTKQYFAKCISSLVNNQSRNYQEFMQSGKKSCQPFRKETVKEKWGYLNDNLVGKVFYNNLSSKYYRAFKNAIISNQPSMLITMIALYRYRNDNGTLPDSLDALVPNYLAEKPVDSSDGKPLRYSKENKMIYSIGIDFIDSEGEGDDDVTFLDDRRFPKVLSSN